MLEKTFKKFYLQKIKIQSWSLCSESLKDNYESVTMKSYPGQFGSKEITLTRDRPKNEDSGFTWQSKMHNPNEREVFLILLKWLNICTITGNKWFHISYGDDSFELHGIKWDFVLFVFKSLNVIWDVSWVVNVIKVVLIINNINL